MPRTLTFQLHDGREFALQPAKIDRPRLYGRSERLPVDNYGSELQPAAVDDHGSTVIRSTGSGYLNEAGQWLSPTELSAVDAAGRPLPEVPSAFHAPIVLQERFGLDEYYDHEISSVYVLRGEALPELTEALGDHEELYGFPFSYRGGHSPETGFLIPARGRLFLVTGRRVQLDFLERADTGRIDEFEDPGEQDLDFSMQRSGRHSRGTGDDS